jgi:transporter family protein
MNWFGWALLSALFAGATAVLAKVGVAGVDSNLATAVRTTVVMLFTWAIVACTTAPATLGSFSRKTWFFLALSGITTGLSWLCYFRALQLGAVAKVAPVDKLSVVVALVLAIWLLGEKLTLREGCGAVFIVIGALLLASK